MPTLEIHVSETIHVIDVVVQRVRRFIKRIKVYFTKKQEVPKADKKEVKPNKAPPAAEDKPADLGVHVQEKVGVVDVFGRR